MKMNTVKACSLLLFLVTAGLTGCETTQMAAKSGPEGIAAARSGGTCETKQNQRSACDDQVGCYWNNETGSCLAH
jgi:hypothetical protein